MMANSFRAFLIASTLLAGAVTASAQTTVYTTNFGSAGVAASDGFTYTQNELTAGQTTTGGTGQNNWLTNDPDNNTKTSANGGSIGGSNFVGTIPGLTGFGAYVGGAQRSTTGANDIVPGAATNFLFRNFALPAGSSNLTFNVDFNIGIPTAGSDAANFATKDSFAFVLRNTAGAQLLSINFATSSNINGSVAAPTNSNLALGYTIGSAGVGNGVNNLNPNNNGINYNGVYHLTISVNVAANTFSASVTGQNSGTIATNVSLSGAPISATAVTQIAATWGLTTTTTDANGAYTGAGGNILAFDNYAITVPEPSTYAACALGLGLMMVGYKVRRRVC